MIEITKELLATLATLVKVAHGKHGASAWVRLSTRDGILTMDVTDTRISARCTVPVRSIGDMGVCVVARDLHVILKSLAGQRCTIMDDGSHLTIKTDSVRTVLDVYDPGSFPELPGPTVRRLNTSPLGDVFKAVKSFTSRDETKYALNGSLLDMENRCLVATDGGRLIKHPLEGIPDDMVDMENHVISASFIALVSGLKGMWTLSCGEGYTIVEQDNVRITSKDAEGKYPRYNRLVPGERDNPVLLVVDREEFLVGCRKMMDFCKRGSTPKTAFRMTVYDFDKGLSSSHPDVGCVAVSIKKATLMEAGGLRFAFNVQYMLDALNSFQSQSVVIRYKDDDSPIRVDAGGGGVVCIIMPMVA